MDARMSGHAIGQCEARGIPVQAVEALIGYALDDAPQARSADSVAVLVGRLGSKRAVDDGSNGDTVWAIIRGGVVRTVMLRRSTQPRTTDAFNVDVVVA